MRIYLRMALCVIATTVLAVAPTAQSAEPSPTADTTEMQDTANDTTQANDPGSAAAEEFMSRYGQVSADSLEQILRADYALCTGDTSRISRDRLFRWKAQIDSMVMDRSYPEKLRIFIASTGMRAHGVRPCEPLVFAERLNRQINEMDSIISAQRIARDRVRDDSTIVAQELSTHKSGPADILNIPAGVSRQAVRIILSDNNIRTINMPDRLQANQVRFENLVTTIAFYFDADDRYTGYEVETEALKAERLDDTVRGWADRLTASFAKRIGPPTSVNRVAFGDIKQGWLSAIARWDRGENRPKTFIGLATHDNLYYAKVVVNY